ncbi:arylsulfotransferase family protein [Ferrimonas balearica]|uniref:arylsulfotransferase family protein n=1 Tax=Ferrimonas balearica TaxID=44012 RepID=UPI001C99F037|nr:arylsulfotransferase family protein [Ferrimonas balearica]MBY5992052.1 arylsulfotransferase family protein [Ferrimonas balearica]
MAKASPSESVFRLVLAVALFLLGGWFGAAQWQPFKFLAHGWQQTKGLYNTYVSPRPALLGPIRYPGEGVTEHQSEKAWPGVTLLQGTLPGGTQIRAVNMAGNELHRWEIDYFAIWPEAQHLDEVLKPKTPKNYHTQGFVVLSDGSLVVNVSDKGTVKLNACSQVVWTVDRMTHHSVTQTSSGDFWIPAHREIDAIPEHLLFGGVSREELKAEAFKKDFVGHSYENLLLLVDGQGAVVRELSVLQALYDAGMESAVLNALKWRRGDVTHVNDVEIVTPALAAKLDQVEAGDLLVSLRQMHMLAVMDQHSGALKWHYIGPWIFQHDPDIRPNGNILVFNNGLTDLAFNRVPGSSLMELDPQSGQVQILYPLTAEQAFYTDILGHQQPLANGNYLITESRAGRVFEVTGEGETVWQYTSAFDEELASLIAIAQRVEPDYFQRDALACQRAERGDKL